MISNEEAEKLKQQLLAQLGQVPAEQAQQADALKEQIKDASPEQLEDFISQMQKAQSQTGDKCLFCQIIEGKIETVKIYEDSDIMAILDINPASRGHMLVFPKKHFQFIHEIPDSLLNKIFIFVKAIESILKEVTKSSGISIYIAQGELAGQRIPHFCVNLIPRYKDDKFSFEWPRQKTEKKEIEKLAEKLREKASKEVRQKFETEVKKETEEKAKCEASEAEKIMKHVKPRIP